MLRHKYTKKRMKNKYNRKKRTRKRGGTRNPKRKISALDSAILFFNLWDKFKSLAAPF